MHSRSLLRFFRSENEFRPPEQPAGIEYNQAHYIFVMDANQLFSEIAAAGLLIDNDWTVKQSDEYDSRTSHIYMCNTVDDLVHYSKVRNLNDFEISYAFHRWRNFKRHEAWLLLIVETVPGAKLSGEKFHKQKDFQISIGSSIHPFDLKVTRFPNSAKTDLSDSDLAKWFYEHQSRQGRFHLANRFFIVGEPEAALYNIELARQTLGKFAQSMTSFRHLIEHSDGEFSRAVVLRQTH